MTLFIEQDFRRYSDTPGNILSYIKLAILSAGFRAILLYRIGTWLKKKRVRFIPVILERLIHHLCHCWISFSAEIGPGFLIAHVGGLIIGGQTRIGRNCDVRQNVTFGGNFNKVDQDGRTQPWIGDSVSFGAGAVVIGPIRIGSNSIIGANTVITSDVPDNVIVFGVPGKIIKERWSDDSERKL